MGSLPLATVMKETWLQSTAKGSVFNALNNIKNGRLKVVCEYTADKDSTRVFGNSSEDGLDVTLIINSPVVWDRLCRQFDLGFAEAYMTQEMDCDNLLGLFTIYITNQAVLGFAAGNWLYQIVPRIFALLASTSNNIHHARRNASFHYDTSNDHFASFLSPDMNYSSALWSSDPDETLETAQRRKVHNIIDKASLSPGEHVLDIGCGWGDLAIEAVKRTGCRVTGLTLSVEQKELAEQRVRAAGLEASIDILLCDYRDAPRTEGGYDCVVSVEMLEHVGDEYMDGYFAAISRLLKTAGGRMAIQGITVINSSNGKQSDLGGFLGHYIFPGGYLPTINQLLTSTHVGSKGSLEVQSVENIGLHYIKTLRCWRDNFLANWDNGGGGGGKASFQRKNPGATAQETEHFRRRWIYYFTYCEVGFQARVLHDYVITAIKTPDRMVTG